MTALNGKRMFPCPVCTDPREVKQTKKGKPYLVCDSCGIQLFVRGPAGIRAFETLLDRTSNPDVLRRLVEMEQRYCLKCSECGHRFWIEPELIKTSAFDGSLKGFRCPQKECGAIVPWEKNQ